MASNEATIAMSLRISEIQISTSGNFTPTLRVGWLSSDFSVFSHWKRVKHVQDKLGNTYWKVGWKSSLVKWVSKSTNNVIIVLFQKVGETESPVAMREIPCRQILNGRPEQKHKFNKLPLQQMKNGVLGVLSGWIRCDEVDSEESSAQQQAFAAGAKPDKASTVSQSTTLTQNSVDMSIDLTMDLPREYYPFISDEDVFKAHGCAIVKYVLGQFLNDECAFLTTMICDARLKDIKKVAESAMFHCGDAQTEFGTPWSILAQNGSVDMSIDSTMDLPTKYYPFISDEDVFKAVFFKHAETLQENQWILGVIMEFPQKIKAGVLLPENCPTEIFIELGMYKEREDFKPMWFANPRQVDYQALQSAAREIVKFL